MRTVKCLLLHIIPIWLSFVFIHFRQPFPMITSGFANNVSYKHCNIDCISWTLALHCLAYHFKWSRPADHWKGLKVKCKKCRRSLVRLRVSSTFSFSALLLSFFFFCWLSRKRSQSVILSFLFLSFLFVSSYLRIFNRIPIDRNKITFHSSLSSYRSNLADEKLSESPTGPIE